MVFFLVRIFCSEFCWRAGCRRKQYGLRPGSKHFIPRHISLIKRWYWNQFQFSRERLFEQSPRIPQLERSAPRWGFADHLRGVGWNGNRRAPLVAFASFAMAFRPGITISAPLPSDSCLGTAEAFI